MRIILASQSPRRRELLAQMGISKFDILPAQGEEVADRTLPPHLLVEDLALHMAEEILFSELSLTLECPAEKIKERV